MNFTDLAFNPMSRMNEVSRYSSVYQETSESLAEHVTDVLTMSYIIANHLIQDFGEKVNLGALLEKCLLHDIDEVITGDVPRNTKYATDTVHEELDNVANSAVKMIEGYVGIPIHQTWRFAKSEKEGQILKVVDMLCVAKKCITEIELRGNLSFLKVVSELETHLYNTINNHTIYEKFDHASSKKFISDLVVQARDKIVAIRSRYQNIINEYHIKENVIEGSDGA